jgi:hypothetical protein
MQWEAVTMNGADVTVVATLWIAMRGLTLSAIHVIPMFLVALLYSLVVSTLVNFSDEAKRVAFFEILFFSFVGLAVAYVNFLTRGGLLEDLVPSFILAITFVFQLFGLSKGADSVPLKTKKVFLSGVGAAVTFIFCTQYLALVLK